MRRSGFRHSGRLLAAALAWLAVAPLTSLRAEPAAPLVLSGTVSIVQNRVSLLVSINGGSGTLRFQGKDHPFRIGGVGVGGVGGSKLVAVGNVYNLSDPSKFPGLYSEFRTGYALGDQGSGHLWLKNGDGVVLQLTGKGEGVALSIGADAIRIRY